MKWRMKAKKKSRAELEAEISNLTSKLEFSNARREELILENKGLTERVEHLERELQESASTRSRQRIVDISKTQVRNEISDVFIYFDEGRLDDAKILLDRIFGEDMDRKRFYKHEARQIKHIYSLDRNIQDAVLTAIWLVQRYDNENKASIPCRVYDVIRKQKGYDSDFPNMPETIQVHNYVLVEEIIGPTLFDFFKELDKRHGNVNTVAKLALIDALLDEQLQYNAFIRTREYGFDKSLLAPPFSHTDKLLDLYTQIGIKLDDAEITAIRQVTTPLDSIALFKVRDGTPQNYKLSQELADKYLNDNFIHGAGKYEAIYWEVRQNLQKGFVSYDHDNLVMNSFQSDEAILGLEDYFQPGEDVSLQVYQPIIPFGTIRQRETNFVRNLGQCGEDVASYWTWRANGAFFRHNRKLTDQNYAPDDRIHKLHHIFMIRRSIEQLNLSNATELLNICKKLEQRYLF